jgi:serine/threonine protein kinase
MDNPFLTKLNRKCGSWAYSSPELLLNQSYNEVAAPHQKIDVFGVAIIVYFFISGRHPFQRPDQPELLATDKRRHISCDWEFGDGVFSE